MQRYITLSLMVAGLSVSATGLAGGNQADDAHADSQPIFEQRNTNGDDPLSAAEIAGLEKSMRRHKMNRIDTDHDGSIAPSELEARAHKRANRLFAMKRDNHDRQLSAGEMHRPTHRDHRSYRSAGR